ncbi:MAG: T9SS type A sorting domain-containing protein [Bacteroidota bacterium]
MIKKLFLFLCIASLWVCNPIAFSQDGVCGTVEPSADVLRQLGSQKAAPLSNATVQVFIHIIRKNNGNQGASLSEVINVYNNVVPAFRTHGICLNLIGIGDIKNNDFFHRYEKNDVSNTFEGLIQVNAHPNAIDIYIVPNFHNSYTGDQYAGRANGIPSKALVLMKEKQALQHGAIMAHELGHCLGLWHTHHGTVNETGSDPNQCPELVDRINGNCDICGDYVCETPADPKLSSSNVDASCNYTGTATDANGQAYTPNTNNIMSYSRLAEGCATYFFGEQGLRIRDMIANSTLLQGCLTPANVTLQNFTIPYNPPGPPPLVTNRTFTARNILTAGPNVKVNPGGTLNLVAENKVILLPRFKAELGSHFCAQIGPSCFPIPNCRIVPLDNNSTNDNVSSDSFILDAPPAFDSKKDDELVKPILSSSCNIIPNPSNGKFNIEITNFSEMNSEIRIEIYNTLGEKVFQSIINTQQSAIDLSTQSKGIYFIKVISGENIFTQKIIIQ